MKERDDGREKGREEYPWMQERKIENFKGGGDGKRDWWWGAGRGKRRE